MTRESCRVLCVQWRLCNCHLLDLCFPIWRRRAVGAFGCSLRKKLRTQRVLTFGFRPPRWGTRWRGDSAIWPRLSAAEFPAGLWSANCTNAIHVAFGFCNPRWGSRWRGHSAIWPRLCVAGLPALAKQSAFLLNLAARAGVCGCAGTRRFGRACV